LPQRLHIGALELALERFQPARMQLDVAQSISPALASGLFISGPAVKPPDLLAFARQAYRRAGLLSRLTEHNKNLNAINMSRSRAEPLCSLAARSA
jgi:hypothetical protein